MTTEQRIDLLDQVNDIAAISKIIIDASKDMNYEQAKSVLNIATQLIHANSMIIKVTSDPSVDFKPQPPCLS